MCHNKLSLILSSWKQGSVGSIGSVGSVSSVRSVGSIERDYNAQIKKRVEVS